MVLGLRSWQKQKAHSYRHLLQGISYKEMERRVKRSVAEEHRREQSQTGPVTQREDTGRGFSTQGPWAGVRTSALTET